LTTHRKNHSVLRQQPLLKDLLNISLIARLVGVNKDKVERLRLLSEKRVEGILRGSNAVVDFPVYTRPLPVRLDELFQVGLDVEGDDVLDRGDESEGELGEWKAGQSSIAGRRGEGERTVAVPVKTPISRTRLLFCIKAKC
jgi:hypothetical protein